MTKSPFLEKYYKPWSITWIIQRSILILKQRRLPQISWHNLIVDYRFTREVRKNLRKINLDKNSELTGSNLPFLNYNRFEFDKIYTCEGIPDKELSPLNQYFDQVYVVNLERRADRRLEMVQKLTRLKIKAEFFPAEDGKTKENQQEYQAYLERPIDHENAHPLELRLKRKVIYSPGAWATLKTYKKLILDAEKRGFKRILCLQDDAVFMLDFNKRFREFIEILPPGWKLLYLGASQHSWIGGEDLEYPGIKSPSKGDAGYYLARNTDGAFAIGIDHATFGYIKNEIDRMNCSFDSGPLRSSSQNYTGECFVAYPNLIIADVRESDIRISRKQLEFAKTVRWNLQAYDFPFRQDLVSVIMPAYNAERTMEMSLRSVMLQSYKILEIIVVNDGSTDRTLEIAEKLAREDERIKVISSPENIGCYPARNLGIRNSSGKYITFQDADDIALKHRIGHQLMTHSLGKAKFSVMRILRSRLEIGMVDLDDQEALIRKVLERKTGNSSLLSEYRDQPNIGLVTSMIDRELFEEFGLFWENRFGADAEFPERVLFNKAGITGGKDFRKLPGYLSSIDSIPGLFRRIDTIGIISPEMTDQNLTRKYQAPEREAFEQKWRNRLQGKDDYQYPTFRKQA